MNSVKLDEAIKWHLGDIAFCHTAIAEAVPQAKQLNDKNALALALNFPAQIGHYERNPAEVHRFASDLIKLSNVTILCIG